MRVWIQNPFDNLPSEGRRKQRYWLMSEAFVAAGHEVVLWTSDFSHAAKRPRAVSPQREAPFAVRLVPTRPYAKNVSFARARSHAAYARTWEALAKAETAKPDLIVASVPTISGAEAAERLARRFGARLVLDVQDAWPETFERLAPKGLRGLAHLSLAPLRRRARRLYRAADVVTGVCERYRALVGRDDYRCAYLGIEPPSEPPPRADHAGLALVYAGGLGVSYDLETIVAAVRADEALTLDVAGAGAFACACPRVRFHGLLDEASLKRLFARCDVGVIPMRDDTWVGLPNKLFDYAAAGLRIVSSLRGETEALLARHRLGVCYAAGDAADLVRAARAAAALPRRPLPAEFSASTIYRHYVDCLVKEITNDENAR